VGSNVWLACGCTIKLALDYGPGRRGTESRIEDFSMLIKHCDDFVMCVQSLSPVLCKTEQPT
jgi:hypothetical protein